MDLEFLDVYDGLDDFQEEQEKKSKELLDLEDKLKTALTQINSLEAVNRELKQQIRIMKENFQLVLNTARAEINRKDKLIHDLRKEKDDICFRRANPMGGKKPTHFNADNRKQMPRYHDIRNESQQLTSATINTKAIEKTMEQHLPSESKLNARDVNDTSRVNAELNNHNEDHSGGHRRLEFGHQINSEKHQRSSLSEKQSSKTHTHHSSHYHNSTKSTIDNHKEKLSRDYESTKNNDRLSSRERTERSRPSATATEKSKSRTSSDNYRDRHKDRHKDEDRRSANSERLNSDSRRDKNSRESEKTNFGGRKKEEIDGQTLINTMVEKKEHFRDGDTKERGRVSIDKFDDPQSVTSTTDEVSKNQSSQQTLHRLSFGESRPSCGDFKNFKIPKLSKKPVVEIKDQSSSVGEATKSNCDVREIKASVYQTKEKTNPPSKTSVDVNSNVSKRFAHSPNRMALINELFGDSSFEPSGHEESVSCRESVAAKIEYDAISDDSISETPLLGTKQNSPQIEILEDIRLPNVYDLQDTTEDGSKIPAKEEARPEEKTRVEIAADNVDKLLTTTTEHKPGEENSPPSHGEREPQNPLPNLSNSSCRNPKRRHHKETDSQEPQTKKLLLDEMPDEHKNFGLLDEIKSAESIGQSIDDQMQSMFESPAKVPKMESTPVVAVVANQKPLETILNIITAMFSSDESGDSDTETKTTNAQSDVSNHVNGTEKVSEIVIDETVENSIVAVTDSVTATETSCADVQGDSAGILHTITDAALNNVEIPKDDAKPMQKSPVRDESLAIDISRDDKSEVTAEESTYSLKLELSSKTLDNRFNISQTTPSKKLDIYQKIYRVERSSDNKASFVIKRKRRTK